MTSAVAVARQADFPLNFPAKIGAACQERELLAVSEEGVCP
jgi:hypothetical protein